MRYNGVMSTDTMPRFTVIASTDHGDFPLYTGTSTSCPVSLLPPAGTAP